VSAARPGGGTRQDQGDGALLLLFAVALLAAAGLAFIIVSSGSGGAGPLSAFLSGGSPHQRRHKMQDTHVRLEVPLDKLVRGEAVEAFLPGGRQKACPHCAATGAENGRPPSSCPACGGRGHTEVRRPVGPGFMQTFQMQCRHCGGRGVAAASLCPFCRGEGVQREHRASISVPLSPGTPDGHTVLLPGAGDQAPRTHEAQMGPVAPGDVLVTIVTAPHKGFEREGPHLHTRITVSLAQALVGFERDVALLDGSTLRIDRKNEVTQPGEVLRFEGRGMPAFAGGADASVDAGNGAVERFFRGVSDMFGLLGPASSAAAAAAKSPSIPAGDLFVRVDVQWPAAGKRFSPEQIERLKRLLPLDAAAGEGEREGEEAKAQAKKPRKPKN